MEVFMTEVLMEKGEKLDSFMFDLKDEKTATVCFLQSKEFVINDWENEYKHYVQKAYTPVANERNDQRHNRTYTLDDKK